MLPCTDCHRSGLTDCPACLGAGYVHETIDSGDVHFAGCMRCEGKKRVRCDSCGGIGWLGADNALALPVSMPAFDDEPLDAHWDLSRREVAVVERLVSGDW